MKRKSAQQAQSAEAQIIELLKMGDPDAVEYWFSHYKKPIQQFVAERVEGKADSAELVQETFVACLKQLPLFRGDSGLQTWMISVAKHQVADFYRKKYAKKALQLLPLSHYILATKIEDSHEVAEKVKQVLSQMSAQSQELLQKKYVDGKKVTEIAEEWDRTEKSVESELFRARNEFRELYLALE